MGTAVQEGVGGGKQLGTGNSAGISVVRRDEGTGREPRVQPGLAGLSAGACVIPLAVLVSLGAQDPAASLCPGPSSMSSAHTWAMSAGVCSGGQRAWVGSIPGWCGGECSQMQRREWMAEGAGAERPWDKSLVKESP